MNLDSINENLARQIDAGQAAATLPMDDALGLVAEVFRLRGEVTGLRNQARRADQLEAENRRLRKIKQLVHSWLSGETPKESASPVLRLMRLVGVEPPCSGGFA